MWAGQSSDQAVGVDRVGDDRQLRCRTIRIQGPQRAEGVLDHSCEEAAYTKPAS